MYSSLKKAFNSALKFFDLKKGFFTEESGIFTQKPCQAERVISKPPEHFFSHPYLNPTVKSGSVFFSGEKNNVETTPTVFQFTCAFKKFSLTYDAVCIIAAHTQ